MSKLIRKYSYFAICAALTGAFSLLMLSSTGCEDDDSPTSPDTVRDTTVDTTVDTVSQNAMIYAYAINFDDAKGTAGNLVTDHYLSEDLDIASCIIYNIGNPDWGADSAEEIIKFSDVSDAATKDSIVSKMAVNNHFNVDPGMSRDTLIPAAGSAAFTATRTALPAGDTFFETANYIGAFNTTNWMSWTFASQVKAGVITDDTTSKPEKIITDDSVAAGKDLMLSADTTYILDGFVFVESGAMITIPAGTVIKAEPGGQLNASALIICRGAKIIAQGTTADPIIMTAKQDDLKYQDDINATSRGLWGGLIVLGSAVTQRAAGVEQIEGINPDDPRGEYGGTAADDSSGVITYVSIRYGGTNIGEGNEINGLTMGGVGNKTVINNIEVTNNADDGFEFFGGSVNTKHLCAIACGDDSYDWDEGFNGKGQFWVVVQSDDAGDRAAEMDGCASDNRGDATGYSKPTIYNATFVGSGAESGNDGNMIMKLREETGGYYYNSIFTDFAGALKVVNP
ncbi:MAG: hypothetical protein GF350_16195 [Chitinivibrionales bacterium]|nr:hypothetical protein [Chitinivibrionales bacterium]